VGSEDRDIRTDLAVATAAGLAGAVIAEFAARAWLRLSTWPEVDVGWKEALSAAIPPTAGRSGETRKLELTIDTDPREHVVSRHCPERTVVLQTADPCAGAHVGATPGVDAGTGAESR